MSDLFSQILSAATKCYELADVLSDNGRHWYEALLDIFDCDNKKWYGPRGEEAYDDAMELDINLNDAVGESKKAAEELCDWWEERVNTHNTQQYEEALSRYQRMLNDHLAWHEQGTGALMTVIPGVENPTSGRSHS